MLGPPAQRSTPVVVGAVIAALFVVVALTCLFVTSSPGYLMSRSAARTRTIDLIPYAVLALSMLVVGLAARRWWQAPIVPVVLVAGELWWLTWNMNFARHTVEHGWTLEHALHVDDLLTTTWHVLASLAVIAGWGLIRRHGWWWALGLLPSAVLVAVAELVERLFRVRETVSAAGGIEAATHAFSRAFRVQQTVAIVLSTLTVVACVWLCVLAERHLPSAIRSKAVTAPPQYAPPQYAPPQYAPPQYAPPQYAPPQYAPAQHGSARSDAGFAAVPSVADEIRKLAELRDAGELTDDEFARQKSRLLD